MGFSVVGGLLDTTVVFVTGVKFLFLLLRTLMCTVQVPVGHLRPKFGYRRTEDSVP